MKGRFLSLAAAAVLCLLAIGPARGARQTVAFFPLENLSDNSAATDISLLEKSLKERLQDRLDVQLLPADDARDPARTRAKARGLGASYILTGAVSRIGRTFTLDLTIAAAEDPGKGRTVVVSAVDEETHAGNGMRPAFNRMSIEAAARLKYIFFGDDVIGEGKERRKIPKLSGTISRSRNVQGDVVSIAWGDTDREGKMELVAAYTGGITVYRVEGDDLAEKARITDAGEGYVHVDAADTDRNGVAEIIASRYAAGKALSDVWEYDGKQYRRIARDIPYFLRSLDLGKEGVVLAGQESDPVEIFRGPVHRMELSQFAPGGRREKGAPLPLPGQTWIYSFTTLKNGGDVRFVALADGDRLVLIDGNGNKLWESVDAVSGTETALDALLGPSGTLEPAQATKRLFMPNRLMGVDLLGDKADELVVMNNLVTAGGFFENIRVFSNSEAMCFAQDGDTLKLAWRTPQTGGSARDAFMDIGLGGNPFRIGVASVDKGKNLGKFGEWRILWLK
jgi:hypothetical protein